jgi:hypothetical protein
MIEFTKNKKMKEKQAKKNTVCNIYLRLAVLSCSFCLFIYILYILCLYTLKTHLTHFKGQNTIFMITYYYPYIRITGTQSTPEQRTKFSTGDYQKLNNFLI